MGSYRNYFEIKRLQNLTTELTLLKTIHNSPLEAVEFFHREISFEAPEKTCSFGQLVVVGGVLHFKNNSQKNSSQDFAATGRISNCVDLGDQQYKYTIEMHRFDRNLWDDFMQSVTKTQCEVDKLFRSMRDLD